MLRLSSLANLSKHSVFSSFKSGDDVPELDVDKRLETFRTNAMVAMDIQLKARENFRNLQNYEIHSHDASPKSVGRGKVANLRRKNQEFKRRKYMKEVEGAQKDIELIMLGMCALSDRGNRRYTAIPDPDRSIVNQAISSKFDQKYIDLLLRNYPKACETGGIVDHINHPIHLACRVHPEVVRTILNLYPECSSQLDHDGKAPIEIFLKEGADDVSKEEMTETINMFKRLDLDLVRKAYAEGGNLKLSRSLLMEKDRSHDRKFSKSFYTANTQKLSFISQLSSVVATEETTPRRRLQAESILELE